ncbi:7615_t:CDS:2 [Funneliformis geosporum]|uniref:Guanosine-3',5'-bis(diphosphate) 3'-pyrophosphohydrolase MESH1 n=1 Tax=Funneliformis geosporum TaxID=1117311 RepID=A0A9W4SMN6_9GLOM|nr:7615_t:CDS:2 [Funneliformis geosporum]CAI2174980.1 12974_t:CDS:2 [Funneliformis geosporum]
MASQETQVSNASFDISKLIDTIDFAAKKHSFQKRKDPQGTRNLAYINHPIGVAKNLTDAGIYDLATIQAAILHDTVEDTDTSFEEIEQQFGREVRDIVAECTDDKTLVKSERKRLQIETTPHKSQKAKEVKLADKLYNLRDLQRVAPTGWSKKYIQEYFTWAKKVTDGARGTNQKLEDQLDEIYSNGICNQLHNTL